MLFKTLKFLLKGLGLIILTLLILFFVIYSIAPIYKFQDAKVFSGDKIYNPYQGMDSSLWIKGNFQVQSRAWMGITNGRHNTNIAIETVYKQLGYDIIVTSDYMKINTFGKDEDRYIPTYEHGYGVRKTHQVCIGSQKVNWIDYPFYQNTNHKQHILNVLRRNNEVVSLAHPDLRDGYLRDDLRKLSNYDLMEVLNEARFSIDHWDVALSSGHKAFILANDDAHNIFDPTEVGNIFTIINTPQVNAKGVMDALKSGNAFGVEIAMAKGADFVEKAEDHENLPVLKNVSVQNDTLRVRVSEGAKWISFIGQNGVLKGGGSDTTTAVYAIQPNDTYVRTEITFYNGTKFYLNPVLRYSGAAPENLPSPAIDQVKTWVQRGIALIITIILIMIIARLKKGKQKKGRLNRQNSYYYSR